MAPRIEYNFDDDIAKFTPRQKEAIAHLDSRKTKLLLYGGALGGGKSYLIRWYTVRRLAYLAHILKIERPVAMIACEDYPSLKDRQISKFSREFAPWMGKMHGDHKEFGRCFILSDKLGGGVICFRNLDDTSKYQSAEFVLICVDELTKNSFETFTFLYSRLRWPGLSDIECQFIGATNPGGPGHGWVKQFWIDKEFPREWISPIDHRDKFAFVQSKATDNPHLDEAYWSQLSTLPEELRRAFRDGDWDIFLGQAFPELRKATHEIEPIWPIPENAYLYMTFDWGFGAPFSLQWWWVDADNRVYLFREWYGWNGSANQGLRLPDSEIATGILRREDQWGISSRQIIRLAGPDCFQKKPDYRGGGQGPSTADVFAEHGIFLSPGDPSRQLKIRSFRERIKIPKDGTMPMMVVYRGQGDQFFRTTSTLVMDETHVEEIDTKGEAHAFDSACHITMARPILPQEPEKLLTAAERDWQHVLTSLSDTQHDTY